jgi:hypothetical protein
MAADPDHRSADGAPELQLRLHGRDKSLLASSLALLAPALPIDLNV